MSRVAKAVDALAILVGAPVAGLVTTSSRELVARAAPVDVAARADVARAPVAQAPNARASSELVGVLLAPRMATLSAQTDTRVERIAVRVGQRVKEGDVLLVLDQDEAREAVHEAEAALASAKAQANEARHESDGASREARRNRATANVDGREIELVPKSTSEQAADRARTARDRAAAAQADVAAAEAQRRRATLAWERLMLRAPFDGVVAAVTVDERATVLRAQTLVRVVGGDGLRVRVAIPETAREWRGRHTARLMLDGTMLFASLDDVAPEVDPVSRTILMEGAVATPELCDVDCFAFADRAVTVTPSVE